jgi:hypothetical protein
MISYANFEAFTAVIFQVEVFWDVTIRRHDLEDLEMKYGHLTENMKPGYLSGSALGYGIFLFTNVSSDRLWGPPSLLSNEYQGLFPWG